ncbi:MAG: DinB family protein [Thermoanaerobaculia bacterium]
MSEDELRGTLSKLLRQSQSHTGLTRAVDNFPAGLAGRQVEGFRHTAWELVEHLRLAAEDLVSYCRDADYEKLGWPEGYWPETTEPPTEEAWHESVSRLLGATEAIAAIVEDHEHDLYTMVPSAEKSHHHTLRAALILLDHNGYHTGQLVDLRLALGVWPPARGA